MVAIRFIRSRYNYADFSTSISPAIELALEKRESPDTAVLNIFNGDSFTVGFFDDPVKSMDLDFCKRENIVVRRRQNAGGAVLGAHGCAFLSLYLNTQTDHAPMKTIQDAFTKTLTRLAASIREQFDIDAAYRPLNDVEVKGKKIVASSARIEKKILTVRCMINVCPTDRDVLTKAITMAPEKIWDKQIKEVGKRFTCLEEETGRSVTEKDLLILTEKTLEKIFGPLVSLDPMPVSPAEEIYAKIYQEKYISDDWFYANSEKSRFKNCPADSAIKEGRHKAIAGLIRATVLLTGNRIHDIIITGDFHPTPNSILTEMEDALRNKPRDLAVIEKEVEKIFHRKDVEIAGTTPGDFLAAVSKALR